MFIAHNLVSELDPLVLQEMAHIKKLDLRGNPLLPEQWIECLNYDNIVVDDTKKIESTHNSDSESEDWEESVPSSEIDLSETSDEEHDVHELALAMLPEVSRFAATGC